jgi:elongation factor 1 alpha-like protein
MRPAIDPPILSPFHRQPTINSMGTRSLFKPSEHAQSKTMGLYGSIVHQECQDLFSDTPWGNVPSYRLGGLSLVSALPPGGLLGGSSKLAALAAARKKKEAEKVASAPASERSINLLDRLGQKEDSNTALVDQSNQTKSKPMIFPSRQKKTAIHEENPHPQEQAPIIDSAPAQQREDLKANPSIFAQTLVGDESQPQGGVSLSGPDLLVANDDEHQFHLPYMRDPDYIKRAPFTKPSPDDVVLRAQRK